MPCHRLTGYEAHLRNCSISGVLIHQNAIPTPLAQGRSSEKWEVSYYLLLQHNITTT